MYSTILVFVVYFQRFGVCLTNLLHTYFLTDCFLHIRRWTDRQRRQSEMFIW